ncbi:hypothetical protein SEA_JUICYJAY_233 [Mycobacterium phage JuicyJay]|uniref:hypothetical protein n=1 Tax=Mycobacterium phage Wanda TaxID=1340713 RepID=UPI0004BE294A|nr:hypothetical protein N857_gp184 [Mycobacterium phage Wanda]ATN89952.1 hypothetical protein SEA_KLEIN_246 [Mycobacterium phage Klein]AXQ62635.1 hypothetical protein SEA_ZELINK_231 [Mycobacterium phage Zelink]QZD98110.1 hypothetical protein SEA_BEEM_241 [Mycobacterium phage Beem]UEM46716.1 hypothetical protein SEA_JUICYJAY_233 [Mycobacterium phage JuicyJay]AIE57742.1 hypothetical protein PBI_WANDA_238 [Mycobacterium phage Wanda]
MITVPASAIVVGDTVVAGLGVRIGDMPVWRVEADGRYVFINGVRIDGSCNVRVMAR